MKLNSYWSWLTAAIRNKKLSEINIFVYQISFSINFCYHKAWKQELQINKKSSIIFDTSTII